MHAELFTNGTGDLLQISQEGDKRARGGMAKATLALNCLSKLGTGYLGLIMQYSQDFVHLKFSIRKKSLKRKCHIRN